MSKKLIHIGPLLILALGYYWSGYIFPGASITYKIVFGFVLTLIPLVPAILIAVLHRSMTKKKAVGGIVSEGEEPQMKRSSFWLFLSLYCTILGAILYAVLFSGRE